MPVPRLLAWQASFAYAFTMILTSSAIVPALVPVLNGTFALTVPRKEVAAFGVAGVAVFAGGIESATGVASDVVEVFDVDRGVALPPLRLPVPVVFDGGQNVATECRGKGYFAGGALSDGSKSAMVFEYDPAQHTLAHLHNLSTGRSFLAVTALEAAGLVLFAGGEVNEDEKQPSKSADSATVDIWDIGLG